MNTLKNRMFNKLPLVALLFAVALPLIPQAYAQAPSSTSLRFDTTFTNASIKGIYGYNLYGWLLVPTSTGSNVKNVVADAAGVMSFDGSADSSGNGVFAFHDTIDLGGNIIARGSATSPIVGTYHVDPDGTGTIQWSSGGNLHIRIFSVVANGTELEFGAAENFAVNFGVAKKQHLSED